MTTRITVKRLPALLVLLGVLVLALWGCADTNEGAAQPTHPSPQPTTSPIPTPTPLAVTAVDLEAAKRNRVAWENRYVNKYALITGEVILVEPAGDRYDVKLITGNPFASVVCKVSSAHKASVLELSVGHPVRVHGKLTDEGIIDLVVEDCTLAPERVSADDPFPQYEGVKQQIAALTVLVESPEGSGSGFLLHDGASSQVFVLTNRHVVGNYSQVKVCWPVAQRCTSSTIAKRGSEHFDVALLSIPSDSGFDQHLTTGFVQDSLLRTRYGGDWARGDVVYASGYPGGNQLGSGRLVSDPVVTEGIVSHDETARYAEARFIEHGADVQEGSSGGPLINSSGTIIGIIIGSNLFSERLELAIPMSAVIEWLQTGEEPDLTGLPRLVPTVVPTAVPTPDSGTTTTTPDGQDSTATSTPTAPPTPTRTPTPTPTPTPTLAPKVGTIENPIPFRAHAEFGQWQITVTGFVPDAFDFIAAKTPYQPDRPPPGQEYVLVLVKGTYEGSEFGEMHSDFGFYVVGDAKRIYDVTYTTMPSALSRQPAVLQGGAVEGFLAFIVPSEEVTSLSLLVVQGEYGIHILEYATKVGYFAVRD